MDKSNQFAGIEDGTEGIPSYGDIESLLMELPNAEKMQLLQAVIKRARDVYYNDNTELMSNFEYDALYDELTNLEIETGEILPGSVTQDVGAPLKGKLPKKEFAAPLLSLAKIQHDDASFKSWLGEHEGCLSWKLDGLTVLIDYYDGHIVEAVTRGNGRIGEIVTENAKRFAHVPAEIPFKGHLSIRGEAVMAQSEFDRVNAELPDGAAYYKNPRNLASSTVRALDPALLEERCIEWFPFTLVSSDKPDLSNSYAARLDWLGELGFAPVEHVKIGKDKVLDTVVDFQSRIADNDFPSDGLVLMFDDVAYGESLGSTSHAPRNGIAYKWEDETAETTVREIFWSPSRTGRLNPVAVFDPVELEGTTVERASVHNLTYISNMKLNIGDTVEVYKSNMIIPQIAKNMTESLSDVMDLVPDACPSCGGKLSVKREHDSDVLVCENPDCTAKNVGALEHFVCRDAMNIEGLSKETLGKLFEAGVVISFPDILRIPEKRDKIVQKIEGIGAKSFDNMSAAVEKAKETEAARLLYALGIREVGRSASRDICERCDNDFRKAMSLTKNELMEIAGIGSIMADEFIEYMAQNRTMIEELLQMVEIKNKGKVDKIENDFIKGTTFVITGDVYTFENRNEFKKFVLARGGKVSGSVSKNTNYLVTNTPDSGTAKNKKAQELGIKIITEDEFLDFAYR